MKMILQKHTSKFVAGLFNSLGITACVSLTSCGDKNKDKQTDNQGEKLKSVLLSKGLDEEDAKVIAEWLEKNKKDISGLNGDTLQEIFNEDTNKIKEVAEKLGLELTESDSNRDNENQKSEITLKIEGKGKVIITNVANSEITEFVFNKIDDLQNFVKALEGKKNTQVEGEWSLIFENEKVKICGHESGFDFSANLVGFFNCFEVLTKIKDFNLQVLGLSLKVESGKLTLNDVECTDDYFKSVKFWTLVKDNHTLFGVTDRIVVEKQEEDDTVNINGTFTSSLKWSEVVAGGDETFVENSGWDKIFKIKNEESKTEVTVKFEGGKCFCSEIEKYKEGVDLNSLGAFEVLVKALNGKNVKIDDSKKFSLGFGGGIVKVGDGDNIDITQNTDFETLLKHVADLKGLKVIKGDFQIKIEVATNEIKLNNGVVDQEFVKKQNFWNAVKKYKELFEDYLPINVEKDETDSSKKGKIGSTVIEVEMFNGTDIAQEWMEIFKKVDKE